MFSSFGVSRLAFALFLIVNATVLIAQGVPVAINPEVSFANGAVSLAVHDMGEGQAANGPLFDKPIRIVHPIVILIRA
jgi:hypothetical protein